MEWVDARRRLIRRHYCSHQRRVRECDGSPPSRDQTGRNFGHCREVNQSGTAPLLERK
jgi:hypothetical protein